MEQKSNIISLDFVRKAKVIHDKFCDKGMIYSIGVSCDYCSLKKYLSSVGSSDCDQSIYIPMEMKLGQ